MKLIVVCGLGLISATSPSFGAPAPLPPIAEVLRSISVAPPPLTRIQNRDSAAISYRVNGGFLISNDSGFDIKDLVVSCDLKGASGTKLDSRNVTIYERIDSWQLHTSGEITLVEGGPQQMRTAECKPTGAEIIGPREKPAPLVASGPSGPSWVYPSTAPLSCEDCPDYTERFKTSNVDLATKLINDPRNPTYLIPIKPDPIPRPFKARDRWW